MEKGRAADVEGFSRPSITVMTSPAREAPSRCIAERNTKEACHRPTARTRGASPNRQLHPSRNGAALRGAAAEDRHHSEAVNQPLDQHSLLDRCVANVRGSPAKRRESTKRPSTTVPAVLAGATAC